MVKRTSMRVVVVTGASGGIGRATALELARRRNSLVLVARRGAALEDLADLCRAAGGRAIVAAGDVTEPGFLESVARRALDTFGRLDAWVNNAAVAAFGRFEDVPLPEMRRVMETNFFGYVHGARAALGAFREQGHGVLVQVASVVGRSGQLMASAYAASKGAVLGLSRSLRQELLDEPGIRVCDVLPSAIDTPLFQNSANHTGGVVRPAPPVDAPEKVACAIAALLQRPRREVVVGASGRGLLFLRWLSPALAERALGRDLQRWQRENRPEEAHPGNLFEPARGPARAHGGWRLRRSRQAFVGVAAAALLGAGAAWLASARAR